MSDPKPDTTPSEADLIPLSALQHYVVCPRQMALIHNEQQWAENAETAHGRIEHEKVDERTVRSRDGIRRATGLTLRSFALGVAGRADVVEFHPGEDGFDVVFPVEHKRGQPKRHDGDKVQLCAQALALEEMLDTAIPAGALFYGQRRRRLDVPFDSALRSRTHAVAQAVRELFASGETPAPVPCPACEKCSLKARCWPNHLDERGKRVGRYLARQLHEPARDEGA